MTCHVTRGRPAFEGQVCDGCGQRIPLLRLAEQPGIRVCADCEEEAARATALLEPVRSPCYAGLIGASITPGSR